MEGRDRMDSRERSGTSYSSCKSENLEWVFLDIDSRVRSARERVCRFLGDGEAAAMELRMSSAICASSSIGVVSFGVRVARVSSSTGSGDTALCGGDEAR